MARRHALLAACAALVVAAPAVAARPARPHHRPARAALPEVGTVTVHRGTPGDRGGPGPQYAETGAPWFGADAGPGYWEANYGREDDAAIFAARYGCARPIWNGKSNRYMSACN